MGDTPIPPIGLGPALSGPVVIPPDEGEGPSSVAQAGVTLPNAGSAEILRVLETGGSGFLVEGSHYLLRGAGESLPARFGTHQFWVTPSGESRERVFWEDALVFNRDGTHLVGLWNHGFFKRTSDFQTIHSPLGNDYLVSTRPDDWGRYKIFNQQSRVRGGDALVLYRSSDEMFNPPESLSLGGQTWYSDNRGRLALHHIAEIPNLEFFFDQLPTVYNSETARLVFESDSYRPVSVDLSLQGRKPTSVEVTNEERQRTIGRREQAQSTTYPTRRLSILWGEQLDITVNTTTGEVTTQTRGEMLNGNPLRFEDLARFAQILRESHRTQGDDFESWANSLLDRHHFNPRTAQLKIGNETIALSLPGYPSVTLERGAKKEIAGQKVYTYRFVWGQKLDVHGINHEGYFQLQPSGTTMQGYPLQYSTSGRGLEDLAQSIYAFQERAQGVRTVLPQGRVAEIEDTPLRALLDKADKATANWVRYEKIGDDFKRVETPSGVKRQLHQEGIHTWNDLKRFAEIALENAEGRSVELVVEQYNFESLEPPHDMLWELAQRMTYQFPNQAFSLVVQGDPLDPATVYTIDKQDIHSSLTETNIQAMAFWEQNEITGALAAELQTTPTLFALYQAIQRVGRDHAHGQDNLGVFLEAVFNEHNTIAPGITRAQSIPLDRRTQVLSLLEDLKATLRITAQIAASEHTLEVPAGAFYWDPVDTILRAHSANTSSGNARLSLGAGQMIATFELSRKLMDLGKLPLDYRLIATDLYKPAKALIWEINEKGTNEYALKQTPVNPMGRKKIYIYNSRQRDEVMRRFRPDAVLLNVPAGALMPALDDALIQTARGFHPVIATPAKAYADRTGPAMSTPRGPLDEEEAYSYEWLIPYLDMYFRLLGRDVTLANNLGVMAGFFEAPKILKGEEVNMTVAAPTFRPLGILARGMTMEPMDERHRQANWMIDKLDHGTVEKQRLLGLELIPSLEMAAFLMAGGANKNFLTYRSSRLIMRDILKPGRRLEDPERAAVYTVLENEKRQNVEIGEEITARVANHYGMSTYHLKTPDGLVDDYRNCLPNSLEGLFIIRGTLADVIRAQDREGLRNLIRRIKDKESLNDSRRGPVAEGTRNARAGYIAEIISYAYQAWASRESPAYYPAGIAPYANFEAFYADFYPREWVQEGEKGIKGLLAFARAHAIVLPKMVYSAEAEYDHTAPYHAHFTAPEERKISYTPPTRNLLNRRWHIPRAVEIYFRAEQRKQKIEVLPNNYNSLSLERQVDPVWGLPKPWVTYTNLTIQQMALEFNLRTALAMRPDAQFMRQSLQEFIKLLEPLQEDIGRFPEITQRLIAIRNIANNLDVLLNAPSIPPRNLMLAAKAFQEATQDWVDLFTERIKNTTELAKRFIKNAQKFHDVELALRDKLGLAPSVSVSHLSTLPPPTVTPHGPVVAVATPPDVEETPAPSPDDGSPRGSVVDGIVWGGADLMQEGGHRWPPLHEITSGALALKEKLLPPPIAQAATPPPELPQTFEDFRTLLVKRGFTDQLDYWDEESFDTIKEDPLFAELVAAIQTQNQDEAEEILNHIDDWFTAYGDAASEGHTIPKTGMVRTTNGARLTVFQSVPGTLASH